MLSPIAALAQIPKSVLAPTELATWPPEIKQITEEIYMNKVATMGCRGMRLREEEPETGRTGYLRGEAFNRGIDQLAALADENLLERAKKFEEVDVIAKFHRHPIGFPEFE